MFTRCLPLATIAMVLLNSASLCAATWRVELDGSGNFTNIQSAVDAAAAGDTIRIGPGRFATFHQTGIPGYEEEVIVYVTKPDLTFIGAGKDVTTIGPTQPYVPYGRGPSGFLALAPNDFSLHDMTIEDVRVLVFSSARVRATGCLLRAFDSRIQSFLLYDTPASIESCDFELTLGGGGVVLNGPSRGALIRGCRFSSIYQCEAVNCSFGPEDVRIVDCEIVHGGIGFHAATGSVTRSSIANSTGVAIHVSDPTADCVIVDVAISGGETGLIVGNCRVTAERLSIVDTTYRAVRTIGFSSFTARESSFLPASGWAVYCDVSAAWPVHALDLTHNNWGTSNAAAIDALIWDHRDDPNNPCTVLYDPYVGQPVPVKTTSWGDLKASFR